MGLTSKQVCIVLQPCSNRNLSPKHILTLKSFSAQTIKQLTTKFKSNISFPNLSQSTEPQEVLLQIPCQQEAMLLLHPQSKVNLLIGMLDQSIQ